MSKGTERDFNVLVRGMPAELQMGWHRARMAMGATKAIHLLQETLDFAEGRTSGKELKAAETKERG